MIKNCDNCLFSNTPMEFEPCVRCLFPSSISPYFPNWQPKDCANKDCEVKSDDTCPDCEFKQNDQTAKADAGKPRLTLVPMSILYDIAEVREYGCKKYPKGGEHNWKRVDVRRYRDAALRHMVRYLCDPKSVDEESGISHLKHLACNIAFLCELEKEN